MLGMLALVSLPSQPDQSYSDQKEMMDASSSAAILAVLNCFHVRVSCPGDGGNSIKLQRKPFDTARDGHELGQAEERNSGWWMYIN